LVEKILEKGSKQQKALKIKIKSDRTTAWRNWGFRQTLKLVLYLEVRSLIYTFGFSNPQLTPSLVRYVI
jgi:hypothetical protein